MVMDVKIVERFIVRYSEKFASIVRIFSHGISNLLSREPENTSKRR